MPLTMPFLRKHVNNTDVAFEILKRFHIREKGVWKFKVRWWNIGSKHKPWDMGIEQKITLPQEAMKDWEFYKQGDASS